MITLTDTAAQRVRSHLDKRGYGLGLRLGVKKTGCSGMAYVVDYADAETADDVVFEQHGLKVLVAESNLPYLDGTEVDFVRHGLNEAFAFHNPNVKDACGCGESFNV